MRPLDIRALEKPLLLQGGQVWNSAQRKPEKVDLLIAEGRIAQVGTPASLPEDVVALHGAMVLPGLMDMHVHFREPGREDKETITSGVHCAVVGGFTAVATMANTEPVIDSAELIRFVIDKARDLMVDVLPVGAVTKGMRSEELAEIGEMVEAGAVAISDDGLPVRSADLMRRALEYSRMYDIPVIDHAEDPDLSGGGSMNEGLASTKLGLKGIPPISEVIAIQRDIALAEYTGGRLHIQHISTLGGIDLLRQAKDRGIQVTGEASPHHLSLTDTDITNYDPNFKMNPPLRTAADRDALLQGIVDGTIDCIASDHAPHTPWEKEMEFDRAPFGILGLETAFGVVYRDLVKTGRMSLADLVDRMVAAPRRILGLETPRLVKDAPANLTILDLDATWEVTVEDLWSISQNTPYYGQTLQGRVLGTLHRGRFWWRAGGNSAS